jgi:hypothetical protein
MLSQHSPTSGSDYESAWRTVNAGSNPAGVTTDEAGGSTGRPRPAEGLQFLRQQRPEAAKPLHPIVSTVCPVDRHLGHVLDRQQRG